MLTAVQTSFGLSTSVELQIAGRGGRARRSVGDAAGLDHRPVGDAADHGGVVGAVDGDGHDLLGGAVDRGGGERVGQRLPDIERLHGRIVVVQRVGPDPGRCQRVGAVAAGAAVGLTAVQTSFGSSTSVEFRSPVAAGVPGVPLATPPASTTRPVVTPLIVGGVVGAVDDDGDDLRSAVDRGDRERIGQVVCPTLRACTSALLLSSV